MIYVRKLFKQDLRNGKQIAFPKEPSNVFFNFDYSIKEIKDRVISFIFKSLDDDMSIFDGEIIKTRLYAAISESRIDGELKAFLRDKLNVAINDYVIFKNISTDYSKFSFSVVKQNSRCYDSFLSLLSESNHSVLISTCKPQKDKLGNYALQEIYYGAPGTGKSFKVNQITDTWKQNGRVVRTTFHPDSDYSTFVGTYKPTMKDSPIRNNMGQIWKKDGTLLAVNNSYDIQDVVTEKQIAYDFVAQAFLQAYVNAWKERNKPEFLIIEEINRGNCAQIFGDLFQLLDRGDDGYSNYAINTDKDVQMYLSREFSKIEIDDYPNIKSGDQMLLPPNLYIWATMNTSDQSLFPIDSAFKRRWKWNYVKIANAYQKNDDGTFKRDAYNKRIPLGWQIQASDYVCDWWEFVRAINDKIAIATISDDKKLGYFFCKPVKDSIIIDEETFVGKVVFYLWNDVFKDNDTSLFKVKDSEGNPSYDDFYCENEDGDTIPDSLAIKQFLINVMGEQEVIQDPNFVESLK